MLWFDGQRDVESQYQCLRAMSSPILSRMKSRAKATPAVNRPGSICGTITVIRVLSCEAPSMWAASSCGLVHVIAEFSVKSHRRVGEAVFVTSRDLEQLLVDQRGTADGPAICA